MVTPRFRWLAMGVGALAFGGLLTSPYHSSERALAAAPGWLYALDGAPMVSRAIHLGLHLAAVWLAGGWFSCWLPARAARIAMLLYALHPLHTQTLASLEARPLLLAAVLMLAALVVWKAGHGWLAVSLGTLAALADWSAAALPPLLWLWSDADERREAAAPLGVLSGVALAAILKASGETVTASLDYFAWQGAALLRTLWLFVLPAGLSADPDVRVPPLAAAMAWSAVAALAALLVLHRAGPWRWFVSALVALAPTAGVLVSAQFASDTRAALALVFLCGGAGALLAGAARNLLIPAGALLAVVSLLETSLWRSEGEVWMRAARLAPAKVEPRLRLAPLVDAPYALELLSEARRLAPDDPAVSWRLGETLARAGRHAAAEVEFARARAACAQGAGAVTLKRVARNCQSGNS